jgi:outer membrane protein OmpA-like peptidoglycan-associated protein/opacity protein-like surface antigen
MKTNNMYNKESRSARFPYARSIKSFILCAFIVLGIQTPVQAQDSIQYTRPSWYFGVAVGGNINFFRGSTQQLDANLTVPTTFHDGSGVGLFIAPLIEFHPAGSRWGVMLQAGYDSRKAKFEEVTTPCNCPADLNTDLGYITIEPSVRFAPFKSDFYLYGGPRLGFNLSKGYTYQMGVNPAYPDQELSPAVKGDFSYVRSNLVSMQVGAGYDIQLSSQNHKTQFVLSPFVSFQPYFGQDPRTIETMNVTTLRVGAALKLGAGHKVTSADKNVLPEKINTDAETEVTFTVDAPKNIVADRRVRETFPVRNYIFFDLGSNKIPGRYVLLKKNQVKDFKEDQLEVFTPKELSGRSDRQMIAYYNVLNILGDRMQRNPKTTINLSGASMQGKEDGLAMAENVKFYLVDVFGIAGSRISTEGRIKPVNASEQPGGTLELDLIRQGDRRVTISTSSPELLMEFQSGPDAPLKPVQIVDTQEAPLDSYVSFDVEKGDKAFSSWRLEIADENGYVQNYGPYYEEKVSIPGKSILGTKPEGNFKIKMIGTTKSGKTVIKESTVHIVLWKAPEREEGMRFSILYEFNNWKANDQYRKYLTEIVNPKIPVNGLVIIHGHTDIIGGEEYNQRLSLARANDVQEIMKEGLAKSGRTDVKFEVLGLGEDVNTMPFANKYPEERYNNRTVIIDIIPKK